MHSNRSPSNPDLIDRMFEKSLERSRKFNAESSKKPFLRYDERGVDDLLEALVGLSDHLIHA